MASKAQIRANAKWKKKAVRQYNLNFHREYDAAIINKLDTVSSKNGYIRELILRDISKS